MTSRVATLPLAGLRQRTGEKWREHPGRVLPFFVTGIALAVEATA